MEIGVSLVVSHTLLMAGMHASSHWATCRDMAITCNRWKKVPILCIWNVVLMARGWLWVLADIARPLHATILSRQVTHVVGGYGYAVIAMVVQ